MGASLTLLTGALLTWGMGEGMFLYFQPIYLQRLGASIVEVAGIFGIFGAAMMVAHIPAGYLSDRFGRKPLLILAWGLGLIAAWVMALASSLSVFVVGWLVYGLTAFVAAPLNSYATAARGRMTPARAMTLLAAAYNAGAALGALAGGWIGEHVPLRVVYLSAAGIFSLSTILIFFLPAQMRERRNAVRFAAPLFANPRYPAFLGVIFLAMLAMYLPQPLTPKFLESERGLSLGAIGLLGACASAGNALLSLGLGHLGTGWGLLLAQGAVALAVVLFWQGRGLIWFACAYVLLGGFRAARSLAFAQVRAWIAPEQMGLAYGISETVNSLAVVLSPLLAGQLYARRATLVYIVALPLLLGSILTFCVFWLGLVFRKPIAGRRVLEPVLLVENVGGNATSDHREQEDEK